MRFYSIVNSSTQDNEKTYKQLMEWRQVKIDDIRFSKKQMWRSIYFTVPVIAALIGLYVSSETIRNADTVIQMKYIFLSFSLIVSANP